MTIKEVGVQGGNSQVMLEKSSPCSRWEKLREIYSRGNKYSSLFTGVEYQDCYGLA